MQNRIVKIYIPNFKSLINLRSINQVVRCGSLKFEIQCSISIYLFCCYVQVFLQGLTSCSIEFYCFRFILH